MGILEFRQVPDQGLPARLSDTSLNATFVPRWKASTAYLAGDAVLSPAGDTVTAIANFTSGASYNAANWNVSPTYLGKSSILPMRRRERPDLQIVQQVMATPPTVTIGANGAASTITSAQRINSVVSGSTTLLTSGFFTYAGAPTMVVAQTVSPGWTMVKSTSVTTTNTASSPFVAEFDFDGQVFEFQTKGLTGFAFRIRVDGKLATVTPNTSVPTDAGAYLVKVDLGSRAVRRIQIEMSGGYFGGLNIGPNDTAWAPPQRRGIRAVILGDSYTEGTGANAALTAHWKTFADLMGWPDVINSGVGSTGYLAPGTAGRVKFRDRLTTDVLNYAPDVVIVAGGHNDTSSTNADIQTEAALLFNAIKTGLPNAKLYVVGPYFAGGTPGVYTAMQTAIFAAASGIADGTIDTCTTPWYTGSGRVGATTGTGNSDLYIGTDNVHPTQAGHDYLARRLAGALTAILPA